MKTIICTHASVLRGITAPHVIYVAQDTSRLATSASSPNASLKEMSAMEMENAHRTVGNGHASAQIMHPETIAKTVMKTLFIWKAASAYKKNALAMARYATT